MRKNKKKGSKNVNNNQKDQVNGQNGGVRGTQEPEEDLIHD